MRRTLITTRYAGPTNSRGSRIIVVVNGKRRAIPFDYAATDAHVAAVAAALNVDPAEVASWDYGVKDSGRVYLAAWDVQLP